jgi:HEAT repeat protein
MDQIKELLGQLESDDPSVAREAAFAVGDLRCVAAVPLLAGLLKSRHLGVQEAADVALRKIGGREVVLAVIPLLRSEDAPARNLSMDILRKVGDQDFPSLVDLVHDEDTDIRIFATDILGMTGNVLAVAPLCDALLKDPEVNVRYQAAVSLGELAKPEAAKCLNKAMEDEEWVQYAVIESLSKIRHVSSVAALAKALSHASDLVASMIIDALGEMGNIQAVSILLRRMGQSPGVLRNKIAKAIVNILGGKSLNLLSKDERTDFRQYLIIALNDEDTDIQDAAIQGLAYLGDEEASEKILSLASAMDPDHDHDRLEKTLKCLANIGLTKSLEYGLESKNPAVAKAAVAALGLVANPGVSKVLTRNFWSLDRDLQREVIAALHQVAGAEAKDFFLEVIDRHQDGTILRGALAFLGEKVRIPEVGERVFALLSHPYNDVKEAALSACVLIGGAGLNEKFMAMAESEDPIERLMAVYALGEMRDPANMTVLRRALEDEIPDIRKVAIEAVSHLAEDTEEWLSVVTSRLHDESREVRLALAEFMGKRYDKQTVPHLVRILDDDDDWVRIRAVEALGGHKEAGAIPNLVPLLESHNKLLVIKVIEALGEIGGVTAFRALLEVSGNEDPDLVAAAEAAIAKIQENQGETL